MILLKQISGADNGREIRLDKALIRLGRMPDNDIVFDAEEDLDASGRHAELRREKDYYVVVDSGSRNGTWLNGVRVRHARVRQGDVVEFGKGGPRLLVASISGGTDAQGPQSIAFDKTRPAAPAHTGVAYENTDPMPQPSLPYSPSDEISDRAVKLGRSIKAFRFSPLGIVVLVMVSLAIIFLVFDYGRHLGRPESTSQQAAVLTNDTLAQIKRSSRAIGRVVALEAKDKERLLCAGFAVRPRIFASTASCVRSIQNLQQQGLQAHIFVGKKRLKISGLWQHPSYVPKALVNDVGLIEVQPKVRRVALVAEPSDIKRALQSDSVLAWKNGVIVTIARVADPRNAKGDKEVFTHRTELASGSPLFDAEGNVVAVHIGFEVEGTLRGVGIAAGVIEAMLAGMQR